MENVGMVVCVMLLGCWSLGRMLKKFDGDGAVKDATKKGVISVIGRLLK